MVEERRSKSRLGKILVVVSVLGLLVGFFLPPPWHPAPAIPTSPPGESCRVYLPGGWSIVRPPGWEVFLEKAPDGSHGSFRFMIRRDNSPLWIVEWSKEALKREAVGREVTYQGRPAWLTTEYHTPEPSIFLGSDRRQANAIQRHGYLDTTLIARHDDNRWVMIWHACFGEFPTIPDMM